MTPVERDNTTTRTDVPIAVARPVHHERKWYLAHELLIAVGAVIIYFGVRGLTEGSIERAISNADTLVSLEKSLRIYLEHRVQDLVLDRPWLVDLGNWIYIWGHWPVIAVVAIWLLIMDPAEYRFLRNAFLISGGIGLVIFALFPVAPPRLAELGLVDTVTQQSNSYRVLQPNAFVNQYAAMPSLHFGWDLLIGITLVTQSRFFFTRLIGVLLPIAMGFAIIATANHFIIDGIAGGALAVAAYAIDRRIRAVEGSRWPTRVKRVYRHAP